MKSAEEIVERLKLLMSPAPSDWREKAQWRKDNREWLRLSGAVALRVLSEHGKSSDGYIRETLGCDAEKSRLILKGNADLTLSEIVKLIGLDGFCEAVVILHEWRKNKREGCS